MGARSRREAAEAYFDALQRAVSCVTTAVLLGRAYQPAPTPHMLSFGSQAPVRLGRHSSLWLVVKHLYRLAVPGDDPGHQAAVTVGYDCRLLDREQRGILAYHWHPVGRSPVTYPHLHLDLGTTGSVDLSKAHLPTGQVSLTSVLRLAISDLGVAPLRPD